MINWKKLLPHFVVLVIFWIVAAIFFSPLFSGKTMYQGDVESHAGMSKSIADFREQNHSEPLWTDAMFGGMPTYQISTLYPNNLVDKIQRGFTKIMPHPATAIFLCMIGFYFLLLTFKVDFPLSALGALAFALSSYFIIILPAGHNSKAYAIAYMAPTLMGILLTLRGRLWLGGALTALSLALEMNANHLQITYYLLMIVLFVGLAEAIRLFIEGKIKTLIKSGSMVIAAVVLGVLPNLGSLMMTNEYLKDSTRGGSELTITPGDKAKSANDQADGGLAFNYAMGWSYGVGETMDIMIPNYNGGTSFKRMINSNPEALDNVKQEYRDYIGGFPGYFGDQSSGTSGPVYIGAVVCFLFILGLFIVKNPIKWWLLGLTILSFMLAWGYNLEGFNKFFFDHIPGYNKFRAPSMILVIAQFTMPLLGFLAINELVTRRAELRKMIYLLIIPFALTGGICFLVAVTPDTFVTPVKADDAKQIKAGVVQQGGSEAIGNEVVAALEEARLSLVISDAWRSFFFIFLAAGVVFMAVFLPNVHKYIVFGLIGVMAVGDLWAVDLRYINKGELKQDEDGRWVGEGNYYKKPKTETRKSSPADDRILNDTTDYRVLNMAQDESDIMQEANTSYFHRSIGGYHAAKLRRYQELFDFHIGPNIRDIRASFGQIARDTAHPERADSLLRAMLSRQYALNMLNTKYIIYNPQGGVLENRFALGNAWFVSEYVIVPNADAEIKMMNNFNPAKMAVVDSRFNAQMQNFVLKADPKASIVLKSHKLNDLVYESNTSMEQLAVFSEIYYDKGWNAYLDGQLTPHFRADYVLRAMRVPAGKHTIEFKFEPKTYKTTSTLALIGSLLLFAALAFAIWMEVKKKPGTESDPA